MNYSKFITIFISCICLNLGATEFTLSSYNCGGLSEHYDYLRACCMQKIMQERHTAEPLNMSLNEKIQQISLKILFSTDPEEKSLAEREWHQKEYQSHFTYLTKAPTDPNSPNATWHQKVNEILSSYKVRPVAIHDEEVRQMLSDHTKGADLTEVRSVMAKRIFAHYLKQDIICLQEADYLDRSLFPNHYEVLFSDSSHSVNGIAWNKERFELVENVGNILDRAFAVKLVDKESNATILVASSHLTGCNPYCVEQDPIRGGIDSAKGDKELQTIVDLFDNHTADLLLLGMDSNVTSLHPRLNIIKDAGYQIDYENHLEPTCANPYQVLNTRIDWIAFKSNNPNTTLTNIPILNVALNSMETNISDHKPIAAKIHY